MKINSLVLLASFSASLAAFAAANPKEHDLPPPGFKPSQWTLEHLPPPLSDRIKRINPAAEGELRLTPTFVSCSVCFGSAQAVENLALEYRPAGGEWQKAAAPIYFKETKDYRGSLHRLAEATDYEARLLDGSRVLAAGTFRTWVSEVPVAKTIEIDPATASYPIVITNKGTATGWIRYTAKPGSVIGHEDLLKSVIQLIGAEYILIDDLKIIGGGGYSNNALYVKNTRFVRIRNCEISGFGRVGEPCFTVRGGGKFRCGGTDEKPHLINWDAAIMLDPGCYGTVVERCYIHDGRWRSNSWYYSHPAGNQGIFVFNLAGSTVLRFNDIVGSDLHRFNDCIEGCANFKADGGFNRDADIYGNFCIFANDDCIELDGGQQNVRCFDNRFESAISDVSIQGCCASPVYVYDNLLAPTCDEFGFANPCIKTSTFDPHWYAPYAWIDGNWFGEAKNTPRLGKTSRFDRTTNNVFSTGAIPASVATSKPVRDLPFILDVGRIDGVIAKGAAVTPAAVNFKAIATKAVPFRVRLNDDCKWFKVEPAEGVMKAGENNFTLTFDPVAMQDRRFWRAAFIIRTPGGLSRCMSVYGERVDFEPPAHPLPPGDKTMYANLSAATLMRKGAPPVRMEFDVKTAGTYWLTARIAGDYSYSPLSEVSVDGGEFKPALLVTWKSHPAWILVNPGKKTRYQGLTKPVELAAGKHTVEIRGAGNKHFRLLDFAVTDNPLAFEPR